MDKAIEHTIKGIKCDNPECDYINMDVKFEDYKEWLDKPCTKCGCNLLTKKDYRSIKLLRKIINIINRIVPPTKDEDMVKVNVEMNGTGKMDFVKINKEDQNKNV